MALEDSWFSFCLYNLVLPLICVYFILTLINYTVPFIRDWFFAHFYSGLIAESLAEASSPFKKKLLSELYNLESKDYQLRNKGLLRIVEIGVGPGVNFSFYPKNCLVTCVDPNPTFQKYAFESYRKTGECTLERLVVSPGENLVGIEDGSVDAVVSTYVLCSVHDIDAVLSEIQRILAPGGKYFFMEHQRAVSRRWNYLFQCVVNPFWYLFTGCDLILPLRKHIESFHGFDETKIKEVVVFHRFPVKELLGSFIVGTTCVKDASM